MFENVVCCGAGKFVSHGEWCHSERIIHSHEIIFVLSGTVYIAEGDTFYELKQNDLLLLDPMRRHFGYKRSSETSFYWLHFTGGPEIPSALKYQSIADSYNLSLLFRQLMHYRTENHSSESLDYVTRLILMDCFFNQKQAHTNRLVKEASAWIYANRDIPLKVTQVAEHFNYNPDYINRLFKANCGKSVKEYINHIKIEYIKTLLLTSDLPLMDVAGAAGVSDYKYFLKFFKYHEGMTPSQFLNAYPGTHLNKK